MTTEASIRYTDTHTHTQYILFRAQTEAERQPESERQRIEHAENVRTIRDRNREKEPGTDTGMCQVLDPNQVKSAAAYVLFYKRRAAATL